MAVGEIWCTLGQLIRRYFETVLGAGNLKIGSFLDISVTVSVFLFPIDTIKKARPISANFSLVFPLPGVQTFYQRYEFVASYATYKHHKLLVLFTQIQLLHKGTVSRLPLDAMRGSLFDLTTGRISR